MRKSCFEAVASGEKTVELRKENDRHFAAGDILVLKEWDRDRLDVGYWDYAHVYLRERRKLGEAGYIGLEVRAEVTHIRRDTHWLQAGVAALSIRLLSSNCIL